MLIVDHLILNIYRRFLVRKLFPAPNMATAFDGGAAELAKAMTSSPRDSLSAAPPPDGDPHHLTATPPRSRHSSSSSEAALLRIRAKIRREAEFVSVRGTLTHVIRYGTFDDSTRTLVIVVPGNPGIPEYYDHFMETLHLASGRSLPVWCVSHAGHVFPDDDVPSHLPPFDQKDPRRSLRGQVEHKLSFVKDHVLLPFRNLVSPALSDNLSDGWGGVGHPNSSCSTAAATPSHHPPPPHSFPSASSASSPAMATPVPDLKLIFIGHSIGCWIICEMIKKMKPELKKQVLKAFLLFPTVERMAVSPNGRFLTPLVTYIPSWILAFPLHLFRLLPFSWRKSFVRFYFRGRGLIPECILRATMSLARPQSVANSLELYYEEANTVVDLDLDFIQANVSKLRFYYGTTDAWVPLSYYHEMKEVFPEGDIHLCEEGYEHAFVIQNSEEMALVVWGWVLELFEKHRRT